MLAVQADGSEVTTIEGLAQGGEWHPVQQAFHEEHAPAVRVLHPRHDHGGGRPASGRTPTRPRRRSARAGGQPVPLHGLPEHRQGGAARRGGDVAAEHAESSAQEVTGAMTEQLTESTHEVGRAAQAQGGRPAASPAGPTGPTTSSCPACCTWPSCAARWPTPGSPASTPRPRAGRPGVVAVYSGRDFADEQGSLPCVWPVTTDIVIPDHPPMAVDEVRYVGEVVAVRGGHRPLHGRRRPGGHRDRLRAAGRGPRHGGGARRREPPGPRGREQVRSPGSSPAATYEAAFRDAPRGDRAHLSSSSG